MIRRAVFWGLLPFVIPQAVLLRRSAPRFAAARGPSQGLTGIGPRFEFLAIGDSIVTGVGAELIEDAFVAQVANALALRIGRTVHWSAYGRIGATSEKALNDLVSDLPSQPGDAIVVSVGVNDVTSLVRSSTWESNLSQLLAALAAHSSGAVIALAGIPPLGAFPLLPQPLRALFGLRGRCFDRIAQQAVARQPSALFVPLSFDPRPEQFSADGFHPSIASYRQLGELFADAIARRLNVI
jgi:lysophospholipase L1-like esterase